ncbi:MAG: hypothetical protein KBA26_05545 [Candidatus Delongbacteria bacterium]|nr:hypothetical protein [Candidatus Delongbacteria bacterium]
MNDDPRYLKNTELLLREIRFLVFYSEKQLNLHLMHFSDHLVEILKRSYFQLDSDEITQLNRHIRFNEIVNEIKTIAQTLSSHFDLDDQEEMKRYKARLIVLAEEKILNLIEYYAPKTAFFLRNELKNKGME